MKKYEYKFLDGDVKKEIKEFGGKEEEEAKKEVVKLFTEILDMYGQEGWKIIPDIQRTGHDDNSLFAGKKQPTIYFFYYIIMEREIE